MANLLAFATDLLPQAARQALGRGRPAQADLDEGTADIPLVPAAAPTTFSELTELLGYLSKADLKLLREAWKFADQAHLGQTRKSGEPYITHPIAVAGICAGWHLDVQALMAALLHDAMEDCDVSKTDLVARFGAPTAELVDGLTKLEKLHFSTREESQAESFRKMLLAMSRDVRVILIKLADRLHNMRTMGSMAPKSAQRIAAETLDIYAPIAHRLGLNQVYRELQDLGFQYAHPWRHAVLAAALKRASGHRRDIVTRVRQEVDAAFARARLKVKLSSRRKSLYAIYRKMREKRSGFTAVNDLFGLRVLVQEPMECYQALGVLHLLYKPVPGRFKDYIAIPKANGYQSLHTTLVNPVGTAVELQIRTEAMHELAELGIAAHWMYKLDRRGKRAARNGDTESPSDKAQRLGAHWLQSLIDIQRDTLDSAEFLEHVKVDLFPDEVYVFTPKSRILALPRGATPVDFAYMIHSDIGDRTVGAQVNGEPVSLHTPLRNGDVVEVTTQAGARPNPAWLNSVRTGRARAKIRAHLKTLQHDESMQLGERLLAQALRTEGMTLPSDAPEDAAAAGLWQQIAQATGAKNRTELLIDIGQGRKIAVIVAKRLAQMMGAQGQRPDAVTLSLSHFGNDQDVPRQGMVFIDGSQDAMLHLAPCCHPIPGDPIAGYLGRGDGLAVHTQECSVARRLRERDSERWLQVEWADEPVRPFAAAVMVWTQNAKGALAQVAAALATAGADIKHLEMGGDLKSEVAELRLLIDVRDRVHLAEVMRALRRSGVVVRVWRIKP